MNEGNITDYGEFGSERSLELLSAVSQIYYIFYGVNLVKDSFVKYHAAKWVTDFTDQFQSAHDCLQGIAQNMYVPEHRQKLAAFYDTTKWTEFLKDSNTVFCDAKGVLTGWIRSNLIVAARDEEGLPTHVIVAIQDVNKVKTKELAQNEQLAMQLEKIIQLNSELEEAKARLEALSARQKIQLDTDELTKLGNRRAYEKELNAENTVYENLVYIAFDVNGLKQTNDTLGHAAGDELLIGAAGCIRNAFGKYGKVFRIGGDEYAAIIHATSDELAAIRLDFSEGVTGWSGKQVKRLHIAAGYTVFGEEPECDNLKKMALLADKRMYADKFEYYSQSRVDRRKH